VTPASPIGGYFGLEQGRGAALPWMGDAAATQSARMALRCALAGRTPARLWVPAFYCPPARDALAQGGWQVQSYALSAEWGCGSAFDLRDGDVVLLVDFFGLTGDVVRADAQRFGSGNVLIDAAMSIGFEPPDDVPVAYSPRKFVGVPDGGWLVNAPRRADIGPADEPGSAARCAHLLRRAAGDVAGGREDFVRAERSLDAEDEPRAMSALTASFLSSVDFPALLTRRRDNYRALAAGLEQLGIAPPPLAPGAAPLCCPVPVPDAARVRDRLAAIGLFCAGYWPGLALEASDPVAAALRDDTLYLPVDQRYGLRHMGESIDRLSNVLEQP